MRLRLSGLRRNVDLRPLTTFGIGGRARHFFEARSTTDLIRAVGEVRRARRGFILLAGGSNVVVSDRQINSLVILLSGSDLKLNGRTITASAGTPLSELIQRAVRSGLGGLETLSGIPGSVGGAIVGNAGAYGQCISDHLARVTVFDGEAVRSIPKRKCGFSYRESIFKCKPWVVTEAQFVLTRGDAKLLAKRAEEIVTIREKKYPPGLRCPGSFFKNVLAGTVSKRARALIPSEKIIDGKIPAGYLLETVGARGVRHGGIGIANYHGNLLVNGGKGTYRDVRALASTLKRRVKRKFGITLEEEIRYIR